MILYSCFGYSNLSLLYRERERETLILKMLTTNAQKRNDNLIHICCFLVLSVKVKNTHEAAHRATNDPISQRFKESQTPSFVNKGANMVKARMVAVGNKMLRRAVPLRIALETYKKCDSVSSLSSSSSSSS
ncbi:hypothetical protein G4B88_031558, partial [Cannabis sativa]